MSMASLLTSLDPSLKDPKAALAKLAAAAQQKIDEMKRQDHDKD